MLSCCTTLLTLYIETTPTRMKYPLPFQSIAFQKCFVYEVWLKPCQKYLCQEPVWQPLPFSHSPRFSSSSWLSSVPQNHPQGQPTAATDKGAGGQRRSGSSVGSIWRLPMYTGRPGVSFVIMLHDRFLLLRFEILHIEIFSPGCVAELHHPLHSPQAPEAPGLVHSRSSKAVSDERCGQL